MDIDAIFTADREQPPLERSLPWLEHKAGITLVIEPRPHWASDLRAFRQNSREYCYYQDWLANGPRARFFTHISLCGEDLLHRARTMIRQEIADGIWQQ